MPKQAKKDVGDMLKSPAPTSAIETTEENNNALAEAEKDAEIARLKAELEAEKDAEIARLKAEAEKANNSKTPEERFIESYKVEENEKDVYHVLVSQGNRFDPATGREMFRPYVQKFNVKIWGVIYDSLVAQGYKLTIIFDPTKEV